MRPALTSLALLAALTISLTAHADPLQFAISGDNSNGTPYTIDFILNPNSPYNSIGNSTFDFTGIQGTIDGLVATFSVVIKPYPTYDSLVIDYPRVFSQNLDVNANNGVNVVSGTANGSAPIITPGTYSGSNQTDCDARVSHPFTGSMPTLAVFLIPTISPDCGAAISLIVGPAANTSVAPEPSTIALLGTGMLGVFGIARRRFFSKP